MGNKQSTIDVLERAVHIATGIPIPLPRPQQERQIVDATAVLSLTGDLPPYIPAIIPGIFGNPWEILWREIQILLQSLSSSSSKSDGDGHFILILLFIAWREYITEVCQLSVLFNLFYLCFSTSWVVLERCICTCYSSDLKWFLGRYYNVASF